MSAIACLNGKVEAGLVDRRAAEELTSWIAEKEAELRASYGAAEALRRAASEVADDAAIVAARKADLTVRQLAAQVDLLGRFQDYETKVKALRGEAGDFGFGSKAPAALAGDEKSLLWPALRAMLARDPHEISSGANVHYLARDLRGQAHGMFADAIEFLRPKMLGLKSEAVRELDLLGALFGRADASPEARVAAEAWTKTAEDLRAKFNEAGGSIPERKTWRLPNPALDRIKVASTPVEQWLADMRAMNARDDVLDFTTGKPLSDADFDRVMRQVHASAVTGWQDGTPSAAGRGRAMLANARQEARVLSLKDDASWTAFAQKYGEHDSPFHAMMEHIDGLASDIAMLRIFGPNPEAMKRFISDLFSREPGRLTRTAPDGAGPDEVAKLIATNEKAASNAAKGEQRFQALWDVTTGKADIPVDTEMARTMGNVRSWLVASQMGSAIISSLTDPMMLAMTARFNGLPATEILKRAVTLVADGQSEIKAAQMGLVADTLAHSLQGHDRYMGETIRSGIAAKAATAVIRASGLRRWTAVLRNAFGLEAMAQAANRSGSRFADLDPAYREGLSRYGIGEADWELMRSTTPYEAEAGGGLLRPADIRAGGSAEHAQAADKFARYLHTEMDYAVIEGDPTTRAMMYGGTRPGTVQGEAWRAVGMYKSFPLTFVTLHFARAAARGWDGSRLGHAAISFAAMWAMGLVAMQAKQIANGKDPVTLDPTTGNGLRAYGAGLLQGGGLGIFGDLLGQDQTRFGNSLMGTIGGPIAGGFETLVNDFVLKNVQLAGKGEQTHFAGDALYAGARFVPGSSLWFLRLGLQRGVVDQLALMIDDRAPARFARVEQEAQKAWGQKFWWRPGQAEPARAPDFGGSP
jgi:hypothetical protein